MCRGGTKATKATKPNQELVRPFLAPGDPLGDSIKHGMGGEFGPHREGTSANRIPVNGTPVTSSADSAWIDFQQKQAYEFPPAECTDPCGTIGSVIIRFCNTPDSGKAIARSRVERFPCRVHPPR